MPPIKPNSIALPMPTDARHTQALRSVAPYFRDRVELVIQSMRNLGWDAVVREGLRSAARAKQLAEEGKGIYPSLHQFGLAADIISKSKGWQPPAGFWEDLEAAALAAGLVSGNRWTRADPAHVQAVPVSLQAKAMRWSTAKRDEWLRLRFGSA